MQGQRWRRVELRKTPRYGRGPRPSPTHILHTWHLEEIIVEWLESDLGTLFVRILGALRTLETQVSGHTHTIDRNESSLACSSCLLLATPHSTSASSTRRDTMKRRKRETRQQPAAASRSPLDRLLRGHISDDGGHTILHSPSLWRSQLVYSRRRRTACLRFGIECIGF